MIIVDTSVFLDELFKFDQKRHDKARILFRLIEEKEVLIVEPEIFKIEDEFEKVKEQIRTRA